MRKGVKQIVLNIIYILKIYLTIHYGVYTQVFI